MKTLLTLACFVVCGLGLATGCGSQPAKEAKVTSQPALPRPAMTPVQAQRNARMVERHVSAD